MVEKHEGDLCGGWSVLENRRKGLILLGFVVTVNFLDFTPKSVRIHGRVYMWESCYLIHIMIDKNFVISQNLAVALNLTNERIIKTQSCKFWKCRFPGKRP